MGNIIARGMQAAVLGLALLGSAGAKAPNIVFILADDLDAAAAAQMSKVKSLITDQGTDFRHHYVSLSLCCPSRTTTLRGQFSHNTGIFKNDLPDGGFGAFYAKGEESSTVATWLSDAGYRTALFGKYLNGYPEGGPSNSYIPPGWTEWMSPIAGTPYKGFNYTMNHNGASEVYGKADADYLTDVISNAAADFIRRSVDQFPDKPFFIYLAPYAPHAPAIPAPRHQNEFKNAKAPRGPAFNESDVSDKPSWVRALPLLTTTQIADIDKLYRKRRQSLLAVDEMVENIINTLEAKGELDNTFIIFTSDNGYHQGQHRLESGKMTAFEEDLLIPMSIRGPGAPAHRTVDSITANVDYAGTFAEIGGASVPAFVDGRSLVPFLKGETPANWRAALLLENKDGASPTRNAESTLEPSDPFELGIKPAGDGPGIDGFMGLRINDGTTYLEYTTGERELYSSNFDAAQLRNSYAVASPLSKQRLAAWLAALKNTAGAQLRAAEEHAP
jgi:N-acetylglucosamine-6-sulfatase